MGRKHHPCFQRNGPAAAEPCEFSLLKNAQQLHLGLQAELPDLVEYQSAVAGLLEIPRPASRRPSECALLVPEKLGFNQSFRYRSAGHRNRKSVGVITQIVDRSCNQLFSCAALAGLMRINAFKVAARCTRL